MQANAGNKGCFACRCLRDGELTTKARACRVMPALPRQPVLNPLHYSSMRIFTVSDLHADYSENMQWVRKLSSKAYSQDTLIVAGDVAEKLQTFVTTMTVLKKTFRHVFFVPGNHDLWCRHEENNHIDSLEKLGKLLYECELLGVETKPRVVNGVGIIPLFSWYHQSFDKEKDIAGYRIPPLRLVCRDFYACKWPAPLNGVDDSLASFFDELNLCHLKCVEEIKEKCKQIISFSHFLPRSELCPEKRMLFYPNLPKVVGSDILEVQVRNIHGPQGSASACHVFGHTHFSWDATLDGVRYIQAPLAYPKERLRRINGGEEWLPLCIYNSDTGGLVDGPLPCYWSEYYRTHGRDPSNDKLAPWVLQFYQASKQKGKLHQHI